MTEEFRDDQVAVVGIACRFPGANGPAEYWRNLARGAESLTWLTEADLVANGVPAREYRHPHYVSAAFLLDEMEHFDARFFGYTPREAQARDPQGRWFLETCYSAAQDSGYIPDQISGQVAVVGGMAANLYGEKYSKRNSALAAAVGPMALGVGSSPDYLATTVSYRLGFRGPSISVQTACSTSLLAVHLASQMLRSGECDYALAGGVEIELPHRAGHVWTEGHIYTKTGHIRPFDASATGTMFGSGVGVVALKRVADAVADHDHIYAVLRGSAVNNDGGDRAGFTAPGVEGQVQLIVEALAAADVHPDSISLIEAHATGTLVGDPIEVAGLHKAYRAAGSTALRSIPVGSVKANIGHLGPASGVASLIKVCLALENQQIPPSINFDTPNPELGLDESPFYVVTELTDWPSGDIPRRAGISSFGIGGTNVHVIVEEPPAPPVNPDTGNGRRWHTIPISAKTTAAADTAATRLGAALTDRPDLALSDVAFTAQAGRPMFACRRSVTARTTPQAARALTNAADGPPASAAAKVTCLAMAFPGQGTQYAGMGRDLYETEPTYRDSLDECARLLAPELGQDIRETLLAPPDSVRAQAQLKETRLSQPALFAVEYSLAATLAKAGVTPDAMIGHSIGEYVAAYLAGVFTLADALAIVAARGRLMQAMEPGRMLAVDAPAYVVSGLLREEVEVEVAAVNGPRSTVLSGTAEAIARARAELQEQQVTCAELATSHAFHSVLMEPCLAEFTSVISGFPLSRPTIPFISNVTGTWITDQDATDPRYWARQLRSPVVFADGIRTLARDDGVLLAEVGPGNTLTRLVRQIGASTPIPTVATMRHRLRPGPDDKVLAEALGDLWCHGAEIDWVRWTGRQRRVSLPPYPFQRERYWADPDPGQRSAEAVESDDVEADWPLPAGRCTFAQMWREAPLTEPPALTTGSHFLVFDSGHRIVAALRTELASLGADVTTIRPGPSFAVAGPREYVVRPGDAASLAALFDALSDDPPTDIIHALCVSDPPAAAISPEGIEAGSSAFYSLLHLGRELAARGDWRPARVHVLSTDMQEISGAEPLSPAKSLLLGPVLLMQREIPDVTCRSVDLTTEGTLPAATVARHILADITTPGAPAQVGWRGRKRWRLDYQQVPIEAAPSETKPGGTYLITGGLGALGLEVADAIADAGSATIVLLGRSLVPERGLWPSLIADPDTDSALCAKLTRLASIEARGCTVVPVQCDVGDPGALAAAIELIHERHGGIRGVYHCAGIAGGAMIAVRRDSEAAAVLAPKVGGTLNLYRMLGDEVEFLVLFSSLTAATGTFGQVDYCAANNFQDSFARWAAAQGKPVYSLGWMQWTESGMYADREAAAPLAFRELQSGVRYEPVGHPLLDRRIIDSSDTVTFSTTLRPGGHWISGEHQLGGQDVVVGASLLEMASAAYAEVVGGTAEIRDVVFLGPIGVVGRTEIRVMVSPDSGGHAVTIAAASAGADQNAWTERMRCRILGASPDPAPRHDLAAIRSRCSRFTLASGQQRSAGALIDLGPHWAGSIKSLSVGHREELARIEIADEFRSECGQYQLHPALLDTAVAQASYSEERIRSGESFLPFSYGRLRAREPLPPQFWVHVTHLSAPGSEVDRMDTVLMHDDGQEIARIDDYAERRVDPAAIRVAVSEPAKPDSVRRTARPHDTDQARMIDRASVTPELGREVLRRVLHWRPAPHLLVVPEGIHRNLRRTQALTIDLLRRELGDARLAAQRDDRVADSRYSPPENAVQASIAELWSASLGVARVGLDDDFFELGGNSLVAVQLTARMREELTVDLPIAVLFEHATIRSLAAFMTGQRPSTAQQGLT